MKSNKPFRIGLLAVLASALFWITTGFFLVPSPAPPTSPELLPGGIEVLRGDRPFASMAALNADLEAAALTLEVSSFCQNNPAGVPDPAALVDHLDDLYDNVWTTTTPSAKYQYVLDESGVIQKICHSTHRVFALNTSMTEPIVVVFSPCTTF